MRPKQRSFGIITQMPFLHSGAERGGKDLLIQPENHRTRAVLYFSSKRSFRLLNSAVRAVVYKLLILSRRGYHTNGFGDKYT